MYPGNTSGTNWGSVAYSPGHGLLVLNTSRLATLVQLIPRRGYGNARADPANKEFEFGFQLGTPYGMKRRTMLSSSGLPVNPPPWGTLAAVDLVSGEVRWEVPLGILGILTGMPNGGGPIVTKSGLVFIGATPDNRFRAFDIETGEELWRAPLPRSAIATPMTYQLPNGKQYVVIAAGGHGKMGLPTGDYVIAFALP